MRHKFLLFSIFFLTVFLYIWSYRGVIFDGKILFPSNFLAQFYSPWVTQKFQGWDAGIPHKPIGTDQIRFFYPSRTFTNTSFSNMQIPLWNPYIFAGNPHAADVQSAVWYPFNILYIFFSQITAWQAMVVLQSILAFVFMYLYVWQVIGNPLSAWVGAIAFGLSGFYITWSGENMSVGHAGLWLPLVLWTIERYFLSKSFFYIVFGALILAASLLAGFFQITVYLYAISVFYAYAKYRKEVKFHASTLGSLAVLFLLPIGLSAIALLPSLEAYIASPRASTDVSYLFHTYLLPITHVVQAFSPDLFGSPGSYNFFGRGFYHETVLYIGLVPLLFALFAIYGEKNNWYVRFFLWVSLISYLLTINNPVTRDIFKLPIPLFSTFLPSRILYLTTFSLAALSGFGFNAWQKDKKSYPSCIIFVCFVMLGLFIIYSVAISTVSDNALLSSIHSFILQRPYVGVRYGVVMMRNILLSAGVLGVFFVVTRNIFSKIVSTVCVVFLILFGQFYFLQKYTVQGERQFLYPAHPVISYLQSRQGYDRFMSFGAPMIGNIPSEFSLYSPEGLDPMFSKRYGELIYAAMHGGKLATNLPRIEVEFSSLGPAEKITDNVNRMRILSILGVRNIAYYSDDTRQNQLPIVQRFIDTTFEPLWQKDNWHVFDNTHALPRAILVGDYIVRSEPQQILDTIFDNEFDPAMTVVLEEEPDGFVQHDVSGKKYTAAITSYHPNEVTIMTESDAKWILVLSDTHYPGWYAYVDGKETNIYRANYTFRSVIVPGGTHIVTFIYKPPSFITGKRASMISLILLTFMLVAHKLWYNNVHKQLRI